MKNNLRFSKTFPILLLIFFGGLTVRAQDRTITGTVTGEDGVSIPGVNVLVEGTTIGTISNLDGEYSITVPEMNAVLVFTYVGMESQNIAVGNSSIVDVVLKTATIGMDEVIVVGYGTQKKSDITGTVSSLPEERLREVPQIEATQALQGAVPGLFVNLNSAGAAPSNNNSTILIRGRNSIKADNDPLLIVDGIPYNGQIRDINPNDIKSIEVLRDASSSAIYGSRGANGVILITTMGGNIGKPTISYDGFYSMQRIANMPDLMNGDEFYDFKMERDSNAMTASEQEIYDNKTAVYWPDLALRNGYSHQHNLSVSGGTENTQYYIAGNFLDVTGLAVNDDYLRISSRINIDASIRDWLTIGTRTTLTYDNRSGISPSFDDIFWMNPLTKAYNDDGTINIYPWEEDPFFSNPLQGLLVDDTRYSYQVVSNNYLAIDIPFVQGLQYKLNTGIRVRNSNSDTYYGRNTTTGFENQGRADINQSEFKNATIENILTYNRRFGKHNLFLTGLYSFENYMRNTRETRATGFPHDVLTIYSLAQANLIEPSFEYSETNLISQMIRANYSFDDRYLFTFTYRHDGYSGFGSNTKWGSFPTVALGWNIANESFFTRKDVVNALKLRASWGSNGNQAVGAYETISRLESRDHVADAATAPGYIPSKLGEDNLGWESTASFNIGLDFGLLSNRITGDINVYNANTSDLLLNRTISPIHGITEVTQNIGQTNNKGIEFAISSNNISTADFNWTTTGNFAYIKNKIVSLYGDLDSTGQEIDDLANDWFIGQPINVNFGYVYDGVWQLDEVDRATLYGTQPGYIKLLDVNNDTLIDTDDRMIQGQTDPKFTWGLTNTISYKNFTLNFFIFGVHGVTRSQPLWSVNVWTEVRRNTTNRNWWTPTNRTNEFYMNHEDANKQGGQGASIYENASFVRLKDLTLAYDLPGSVLNRVSLSKLRIFFTGRNLLTFTEWTGLDPELDDQRAIPMQREYVFGLSFGF